MNRSKYLIFFLVVLIMSFSSVYASCTNEEINNLKQEVNNVKITYKHLKDYEIDGETTNNHFEVTIKNLPGDIYISLLDGNIKYTNIEEEIKDIYTSGTWNFEFYSNKCNIKINEIKVKLPKYNPYSEEPLCEGIDGNDFPLCGKYYDYNVNYDSFETQVKHYRATHKIEETKQDDNIKNKINIEEIINKIIDFIKTNYLYLIVVLVVVILITIIIIIVKKRKKRGVLK